MSAGSLGESPQEILIREYNPLRGSGLMPDGSLAKSSGSRELAELRCLLAAMPEAPSVSSSSSRSSCERRPSICAFRPLPEFQLQDVRGNKRTLARFKGRTIIAVVWATWCAPCVDPHAMNGNRRKCFAPGLRVFHRRLPAAGLPLALRQGIRYAPL